VVSQTRIFAHHPQKKIIKKKQDRRPKKHRLSDVTRRNVNLNKCISKFQAEIPEYSIIASEGNFNLRIHFFFIITSLFAEAGKDESGEFWTKGHPSSIWIAITADDELPMAPKYLPVTDIPKPLIKSRSLK
jgi:hypothetical protein